MEIGNSATHATLTLEMLGAMRGDMAHNPSMMDPLSSLTAALQPCSPPGNDNHQSLQYGIDVPSSSAKARMPGCKPPNTVNFYREFHVSLVAEICSMKQD